VDSRADEAGASKENGGLPEKRCYKENFSPFNDCAPAESPAEPLVQTRDNERQE
jgi:hypothetical protein